tara:strand:- start:197 stop:328 length:132 start_codon:yes stop_codon:yes gene_type:complete
MMFLLPRALNDTIAEASIQSNARFSWEKIECAKQLCGDCPDWQ